MDKVIPKDKIAAYLETLMGKYTVVAPIERAGSPAEFRELRPGDAPVLSGDKMMMPPKDYLLPRYEPLIKVTMNDGRTAVAATIPEDKPRVMMGMWLADAQAIQVLDRVFLDKRFTDPYYSARRVNTTLIATIPARSRWSRFCTSVDDVETWKQSVDALMYDLGDLYYFEPVTDKGGALIDGSFTDPTDADSAKKDELWNTFKDIPRQSFAGKALYDNLEWGDAVWSENSSKMHRLRDVFLYVPELQLFRYSGRDQRAGCRALPVPRWLPVRRFYSDGPRA